MKKVKYKISKISCTNCVKTITNTLDNYFGDSVKAEVNINTKKVYITYDENKVKESEIIRALKNSGYPIDEVDTLIKEKIELVLSIILSIPLLLGMLGHLFDINNYIFMIFMNPYFQIVLASIIQFYIGRRFYIGAYHGIKQRVLGMDFLVALGSLSAYIYSLLIMLLNFGDVHVEVYFEVSALIITIVLVGKFIEAKMQSKTTDVIDSLIDLNPKKAYKIEEGEEKEINYEDIKEGDILLCYASNGVPADGIIVEGSSYIDDSSFTGESKLVLKNVDDIVIGGSINTSSTIKIKVTATGDKSVLSQIISSVEEATLKDTKFQKIADKVASIFVPIIIVIALFTFLITYLVLGDLNAAITNALAVILISCPCALGLATPTSIMVSNQIASKHGLLYKSAKFFELADRIDIVAFDKTGTITKGVPSVDIFEVEKDYINILYALEKNSKHPISKQLTNYLSSTIKENDIMIDKFEVVPGFGIRGMHNKKEAIVGKFEYIKERKISFNKYYDEIEKCIELGKTLSVFAYDNKVVGYYTVEDEIKEGVVDIVERLKQLGIKPIIITGDNEFVAKIVATNVGIEEYYANVLPVQKADILKKYKEEGKIVAMIGDGVNDAVALKVADVGISVNNASDIASLSSDVVLMKNDLNLLVDGIIISKRTIRNIKQNFIWAFSYNIIAIPLAATGNISMILATIAMSFSSIIVVFNAMRLKKDKIINSL